MTDSIHGVVYQGQPVLNANDHEKGVNLTHFGDCNSKKIYEEAKKEIDETYKAEEGDGFFTRLGKGIVKANMKTEIFVQENLMFHKCELDTPLPWIFTSKDHMIDGAPALTMESQCACRYGGIITIVAEEEEPDSFEQEKEATISTRPSIILTSAGENPSPLSNKMKRNLPDIMSIASDITQKIVREAQEMKYINKYVTPKTLVLINKRWANETLTEKYGGNFFSDLRESMYEAGIMDEKSVLMFLCSIGEETGYGTSLTEKYNEGGKVVGNTYTINTRGAGLIQVTGETQKEFMGYLKDTLSDGTEKEEVENYWEKYEGDRQIDNSYGDAAKFIAENYAIESAIWFWGVTKKKVATFDRDGQTNMTINEFIESFSDRNPDNVFLATQYVVNGTGGLSKGDLEDICNTAENVFHEGDRKLYFKGKNKNFPNGWEGRKADWERAKGLMEHEQ